MSRPNGRESNKEPRDRSGETLVIITKGAKALSLTVAAGTMVGLGTPVQGQDIALHEVATLNVRAPLGHRADVVDGVFLGVDRLVVLEEETKALLLLDSTGQLVSQLSTNSRGAGVLRHPVDLATASGGDVFVLDAQVPRVARYKVARDSLSLDALTPLYGLNAVSGVCDMHGVTLVLGLIQPVETSPLVHRLRKDGSLVSSFGNGFGPAHEMTRLLFGAGHLQCLPSQDLVVVASAFYPEVRGYDDMGRLRWQVTIPDFRPMSVVESPPGTFRYTLPEGGRWDHTTSQFTLDERTLAIQITRRQGRGTDAVRVGIRTLLVALEDGRIIREFDDWPSVTAADHGRVISAPAEGPARLMRHLSRNEEEH